MPAEKWLLSAAGKWECSGRESFTNRDSLVYGNYRPSELNTGVLNLATLDTHTGDFVTTGHGQLVENLDITGRIKIRHNGTTFKNCRAQGGLPNGEAGFGTVEAFQARTSPTRFYDCTFISNPATNPAVASLQTRNAATGIQGQDFELYRCDISGGVDGVGAQIRNVTIKGCKIHGLVWYPDAHSGNTPSHNDGIQVHGGTTFTIVGNSIEVGQEGLAKKHTSAIIVTQDSAATSNVVIDKNWLYSLATQGCAVGINITQTGTYGPGAYTGTVQITNNRFSALTTWESNHAALIDRNTYDIATISGNVYDETGLPAKVTRA